MQLLGEQFERALKNVSVSGAKRERAILAHKEVRELLESDATLRSWGADSILIGSYGRRTSRFPAKDVDIFVRFNNLTVSADPAIVYNQVYSILINEYGSKEEGGRVTKQARSLKIDFDDSAVPGGLDSFSVDGVPAVQWNGHWGIPNKDPEAWRTEETRWVKTDPVQFGDDTDALAVSSRTPQVGSRNAYRPIVRLVRQARHIHLRDFKPGGLYAELATYYAWKANQVHGSSWAVIFAGTLAAVAKQFEDAAHVGMVDPVLHTPLSPGLSNDEWSSAAVVFAHLAAQAKDAVHADDRCRSAYLWRQILGENERGSVFPLPDGCDARGLPISNISAVSAVGSNQPRGFA